MRRYLNKGGIVLALFALATAGLVTLWSYKMVNAYGATAKEQSSMAIKRTKAESTWARWQYQVSYTPTRNSSSVKLSWALPSNMRISGSGISHSNGQTSRTLKSVVAGRTVKVVFWAWSSKAAKLCFTVKASTGGSAHACNPNPGPQGSGQPILSHYGVTCQQTPDTGSIYACLNNGVANLRISLDDECGCYDYGQGLPDQVTIYPQDFSFGGDQPASFSGKIITEPGGSGPNPTKKDKRWYWTTVEGQKVPQWLYGHLSVGSIPNWLFTITVPPTTDQICISVVAQPLVWVAKAQTSNVCITSP